MSQTNSEPSGSRRAKLLRSWTTVIPIVAAIALALTWGSKPGGVVVAIIAVVLIGAIAGAVHHAEVVAHRVGEPFGSIVLAVAVTVIEVALIVTLMVSGGPETSTLARDTVFAAVMITTNGIVGLALWIGTRHHGMAIFNAEGAGAALATVAALAGLTMVLPNFTMSRPGPEFSPAQLTFAACASLVLYALFITTQTVRHRDFFMPVEEADLIASGSTTVAAVETTIDESSGLDVDVAADDGADRPSGREAMKSVGLLLVALVAVVGLAKVESPAIESGVASLGFPQSFVGVVIALLVLMPEGLAAVRAARRNRVQTSLNLAYGSAMASIGLTIPAIALASIWLNGPLLLGLNPTQMVLLALTVAVGVLTVVPGRATRLQGGVHLVLFASFFFLAIYP